jgi:esterase/lipase superfamily enzyme
MFIVSSRADFVDPDKIIDQGFIVRDVDLESADESFDDLTMEDFLAALQGKHLCILIHGYNNECHEVYDSYQIIDEHLRQFSNPYDIVVGFSWPGGNSTLEWWDAVRRANAVGRKFRHLLEQIKHISTSIDLISHSLGARVCLKALKNSKDNSRELVKNYYCMAAAVDNESLEEGEEFFASRNSVDNIYVMHSARDGVLAGSYKLAELDNALGLFGPENKSEIDKRGSNVYVANCKQVVSHHGGYKRSIEVYSYIEATRKATPRKRFITL